MTDRETKAQPGVPDLATLLFEIDDAWRAMHHGRAGVQPDVDPVRESERLAAAWRAFPQTKGVTRYPGGGTRQAGGTVAG